MGERKGTKPNPTLQNSERHRPHHWEGAASFQLVTKKVSGLLLRKEPFLQNTEEVNTQPQNSLSSDTQSMLSAKCNPLVEVAQIFSLHYLLVVTCK